MRNDATEVPPHFSNCLYWSSDVQPLALVVIIYQVSLFWPYISRCEQALLAGVPAHSGVLWES